MQQTNDETVEVTIRGRELDQLLRWEAAQDAQEYLQRDQYGPRL